MSKKTKVIIAVVLAVALVAGTVIFTKSDLLQGRLQLKSKSRISPTATTQRLTPLKTPVYIDENQPSLMIDKEVGSLNLDSSDDQCPGAITNVNVQDVNPYQGEIKITYSAPQNMQYMMAWYSKGELSTPDQTKLPGYDWAAPNGVVDITLIDLPGNWEGEYFKFNLMPTGPAGCKGPGYIVDYGVVDVPLPELDTYVEGVYGQ